MLKVIAVDDEPLALGQLEKYIAKVPFLTLAASCSCALEASEALENNDVDAMFMDINMPDLSGLEFIKALKNPPMVVFTTAYSEYALEGFKVDAVDYLLKPFTLSEFIAASEKLKARHMMSRTTPAETLSSNGSVFFKSDYKIIRVDISDIVYIEGMSEYLKIHLSSETAPKVVLMSFSKLLEKLPRSSFVRVHRSYVINLTKILEVSAGTVLMSTGKVIPVSDSYRNALMKML